MTIAYANGAAVYGSTALDSLASSATLVAGNQSPVVTNTGDNHLLSVRLKANASAPTAGKAEVWVIPVWDIAGTDTYPDVFDATGGAKTVSHRNVLSQCGECVQTFETTADANRVYETSGIDLESIFGTCPEKYVVFTVHSMVTALNATASAGGQVWAQQITY